MRFNHRLCESSGADLRIVAGLWFRFLSRRRELSGLRIGLLRGALDRSNRARAVFGCRRQLGEIGFCCRKLEDCLFC